MNIKEKLLTKNEYSRPGKPLAEKRAVILHWVGVGGQRAINTWGYFETGCPKEQHYASAHYIVDLNGDVYHAVPDNEVAYHCGSAQKDPKSGRVYTDWARSVFDRYAEDPQRTSPNNASLGIELCVIDNQGNFTPETLQAAVELTAQLCNTYHIPLERVGTHHLVVGWKDCPRLWTNHPEQFEAFKARVRSLLV
jgi:N-acetylmuramoyl-L-alanine amidase